MQLMLQGLDSTHSGKCYCRFTQRRGSDNLLNCAICHYRHGKHELLIKHLMAPLFFFLPVTLIDLPFT
ncbi:unnamed protein product, partial [Gongylonema pulchrum]|uniref:Ovule protein n=1 Tax=Gongylonema pulchrum TaxID=637853 RepID=A0A183E1L3_9BILA